MNNYSEKWISKMIKEIKRLENHFGDLETYYNIPDKRLNINFLQKDKYSIIFNIKFTRCPWTFLLKKKINKYVLKDVEKFATEEILINFFVEYPHDFPFSPPKWLILKYNDNILNENISKYYEYIIKQHNESYELSWCPAISLRVDLLDIIEKFLKSIKYTLSNKKRVF